MHLRRKPAANKNLLFHSFDTLQWNCIQNKISPNNGILLNGILK